MKITFDADGKIVEVPYTLELLDRYNDTLKELFQASWFPIGKQKRITQVFIEFAKPYFPKDFNWQESNPLTGAFFFQRVKEELQSSIENWQKSMNYTDESTEATGDSLTNLHK